MQLDQIFPSRFFKAADLQGREHRVKIQSPKLEQLGDERKLVITFVDRSKEMVCNKTNAAAIVAAFGNDTDGWNNREIILLRNWRGSKRSRATTRSISPSRQRAGQDYRTPRHSELRAARSRTYLDEANVRWKDHQTCRQRSSR